MLHKQAVATLNLPLQAKREILRKILQLPDLPLHFIQQVINFRPEIILNTKSKQSRRPKNHIHNFSIGKPQRLQVIKLGDERRFDAGYEEESGLAGDSMVGRDETQAAEEVEGGAELGGDAGDEEAGAAVHIFLNWGFSAAAILGILTCIQKIIQGISHPCVIGRLSSGFSVPMVLVKIRRQVQGEGIHRKKLLCSNVNALGLEDSDDDSAVLKLASAGCELAMVEDQFCSIPYELYDLPDLKEILSLETWNSCLTEEERFSLSAFLPDVDQHTFWLTMKELLSGKNMFFGSPLTVFFERMKGGFYPSNVTCLREGLQFLQKRTYYHSLRLYHENMNRTFSDMKKAWSKCRSSISVEERVHIWNNSKNHRAMTVVDLNAFPEDEDLSEKSTVRASTDPVPKTVKYPPVIALAPLKTNGKGVLKVKPKPAALYSIQTGMVCRPTPKGVLKVVPRGPLSQMHEPRTIPGRQELPTLADRLGFQTTRLSPFPQSTCGWDAEPYCEEAPLPYQSSRSGRACKSLKPPDFSIDRQRVKHLKNCTPGPSGNFLSSFRKKRYAKDPTFVGTTDVQEVNSFSKNCRSVKKYYRRSSQIQEHLNGEDLWQNIGQQKREHYQDSREQQMVLMHDDRIQLHPKTLETVLRVSGVGTGQQQILAASLEQPKEVYRDVNGGEIQQLCDEPAVPKGLREAPTLPITYKRRKAFSKVNKLDIANPQTAGVNLESRTL